MPSRGSGTLGMTDAWSDPLFPWGGGLWCSAGEVCCRRQQSRGAPLLLLCVWERNLFPSATIDGDFPESTRGWEINISIGICLIPRAVLTVRARYRSFSSQRLLFAGLNSVLHLIFPLIINSRFSKHRHTRRFIVLIHWVEKRIDLSYFRVERTP